MITAAMVLSMMPLTAPAEQAEVRTYNSPASNDQVTVQEYYDTTWDGSSKKIVGEIKQIPGGAKVFAGSLDFESEESVTEEVWYVVQENMTVDSRLYVLRHKTVNLVIKDGVTLTCNKGIEVARRDGDIDPTYQGTLNIYGETESGVSVSML